MEWNSLRTEWLPMLVPGVVFLFGFDLYSRRHLPFRGSTILAYLMVSVTYIPLTDWFFDGFQLHTIDWHVPLKQWLIPLLTGVLFGLLHHTEAVRHFLRRRLRMYLKSPSPRAWDWVMGDMDAKGYLNAEITLKDGKTLSVALDGHSASQDLSHTDLYAPCLKNPKVFYYVASGEIRTIKIKEITDEQKRHSEQPAGIGSADSLS